MSIIVKVWLLIVFTPNGWYQGSPATIAHMASEAACKETREVLETEHKNSTWGCVPAEIVLPLVKDRSDQWK